MRMPTLFRSYAQTPSGDGSYDQGTAGADGDPFWLSDLMGGGPDVNPELSGRLKFAVYDEMRKTDATIKSVLWLPKLTIRAASWGLNPRDPKDATSVAIRDMVAWNLGLEGQDGQLDISWEEALMQALTMLDFGPSFEELVWADDLRPWHDADGDVHLVRPLVRLAPRLPKTIYRVTRDGAGIGKLEQSIPGTKPIPGSKLTYHVFEREGNSWDGVSMIRSCWGPWRLKKHLMIVTGIGWDRFATGLPIVYHPNTPEGESKAKAIGRSIRTHERGYVHLPKAEGVTRDESDYLVDVLNATQSIADPVALLNWCSNQEAEAGFQQFLRQGMGHTGARASAETQIDPFYLSVQAIADYVRRERSRQVIRRIVTVNFGAEAADKYSPILTVSKTRSRDVQTMSAAIAVLADAGFTFTDRGAIDDVRDLLGFPKLPEDIADAGIPRDQLISTLQGLGLDSATFASIVNALPPDVGVARNRVPEGTLLAA